MCFQSSVLLLFPALFEIEPQSEQKQFCSDVLFTPSQKPSKSEIILEQTKCAFHLNRTADTQINALVRRDVRLRHGALLFILLSYAQFFWLVRISSLAAFRTFRTAGAILTTVMADSYIVFAVLSLLSRYKGRVLPMAQV